MNFKWKESWTWMIVTVLAVMAIWPVTRPIFLWLLPLGRGWDDFLEMILIIAAVIVLVVRLYIKLKRMVIL